MPVRTLPARHIRKHHPGDWSDLRVDPVGVGLELLNLHSSIMVPTLLSWICFFYVIFVSLTNASAELTCHGDRVFYVDWWNSSTIESFWKRWNLPVYEFTLRHVAIDSTNRFGLGKTAATALVFLFSALFHEVVFVVAFETFFPVFFVGMMAQIPLFFVSRRLRGTRRGNMLVWSGLFLSFPVVFIAYCFPWMAERNGEFFCLLPRPAP